MSTDNGHLSGDGQQLSSNIGWKMMRKMGYVSGAGLGKYEHGRLEPVIPKQAPKKVSLDNFSKLAREFEKRRETANSSSSKDPIRKILRILRRNRVLSREKRSKLTKIFVKKSKSVENRPKTPIFEPKSPIFVPEYESDCEILLDKSQLPPIEPEIVTIEDQDDDDDLTVDQNEKWTSENFRPIGFDHVIDISPSTSSMDSIDNSKINILIRNSNPKEEITKHQFLGLKKIFDQNLDEMIHNDDDVIVKIDRFDMISKFRILIVSSSEKSIITDWLSKIINDTHFGFEILEQRFKKIALLVQEPNPNLTIEILNRQNPDLGISDFWRLDCRLSIIDDFSSLFFTIENLDYYSKLKNRQFRLYYRLGEISVIDNLSIDDVMRC